MLCGLISFAAFAPKTLGPLGIAPTRHPDPAVQRQVQRNGWAAVVGGLAAVALVVALCAMGTITIDARGVGEYMAYVLVGLALVFFAYLFLLGGLTSDEPEKGMRTNVPNDASLELTESITACWRAPRVTSVSEGSSMFSRMRE